MNNKIKLKQLKKELIDLQENRLSEREMITSKVGNEMNSASSTVFLLIGVGSFVLLGVCWKQLAPILKYDTDIRPIICFVGAISLIIGFYQFFSVRKNVNYINEQEIANHKRINSIKKQIVDLEE